jgi:hypothetical protein
MHLTRFATSLTLAFGLLATSAFGREGLSSGASSLKQSLDNLRTTLASRDFFFKMSNGSLLSQIDRTASAADTVGRLAANGESRQSVGDAMNALRGRYEGMRGTVHQLGLEQKEREALRAVDVRYGDVVRYWQAYGGAGGEMAAIRRPDEAPAEASRPEAPAQTTTTTTSTKVTKAKPAEVSQGGGASGRARTVALNYLANTYRISARAVEVHEVINLGAKYRVTAFVGGHLRAIDLNPATGEILLDMLVN